MEVHFRGSLTRSEFLEAARLAARPITRKEAFTFDLWKILLAAGLVLGSLGIGQVANGQASSAILLLLALFLTVIGVKLRRVPSASWEKDKEIKGERWGTVSSDSLDIATPQGHSQFPWSAFTGFGSGGNVLILFHQSGSFIPLSSRFFASDVDWTRVLDLLGEMLPVTHRLSPSTQVRIAPRHLVFAGLLFLIVILLVTLRDT